MSGNQIIIVTPRGEIDDSGALSVDGAPATPVGVHTVGNTGPERAFAVPILAVLSVLELTLIAD